MFFMGMKKYFFLGMATMLALVSCHNLSNEDLDNMVSSETEGWKMTMVAVEAGSKASVAEDQIVGGSRLPVRWDEADKVMMMIGTDADHVIPCEFVLKGEATIGSAVFEYVGDKVAPYFYYGIYPSLDFDEEGNVHLSVPVDGTIEQIELDDSRHLGTYRAMYSAPMEREECSPILTGVLFRHLTGLVIFKIANMTDEKHYVREVQLATSDGTPVFYASALFNPVEQEFTALPEHPVSSTSLRFKGNGFMLPPNETHKAYLPVLPTEDFSNVPLLIRMTMDNGEVVTKELPLSVSESLGKFFPGTYCIFNVKKTTTGLSVGIETSGWENGSEIVIPVP